MAHLMAGIPSAYNKREPSRIGNIGADHVDVPAQSPLDFVAFFPYLCRKLELGDAIVIKLKQESSINTMGRRKPTYKSAKNASYATPPSAKSTSTTGLDNKCMVTIQAYHNARDRLVEIAIVKCEALTQKHIKALMVCLPFQTALSKVNIIKCSLGQEVLYQIGNLVFDSTITDLCLDDTFCEQGNYYVVLKNTTNLKRLSMNRCQISDAVVQHLFTRLASNSKNLQILELSSNFITDQGALIIGNTLRTNRILLHINLAGNQITDRGLAHIFNALMEFELTDDEIRQKEERQKNYFMKRLNVYQACLADELKQQRRQVAASGSFGKTPGLMKQRNRNETSKSPRSSPFKQSPRQKKLDYDVDMIAAKRSMEMMGGPFRDVFDGEQVRYEDGKVICWGNLKLASINIAYNRLTHGSLSTINKVLDYQVSQVRSETKLCDDLGLVRIVVNGNSICENCSLLLKIIANLDSKKLQIKSPLRIKSVKKS